MRGGWSHCISSQEAESRQEIWWVYKQLMLTFGTPLLSPKSSSSWEIKGSNVRFYGEHFRFKLWHIFKQTLNFFKKSKKKAYASYCTKEGLSSWQGWGRHGQDHTQDTTMGTSLTGQTAFAGGWQSAGARCLPCTKCFTRAVLLSLHKGFTIFTLDQEIR